MVSKRTLPLAAMEKLLKQAGAARVSDDAKAALKETLEEMALDIGAEAWKYAQHAGRKTVKAVDIKLASK
ncbi:MAG: histone [DPANN group archaeon]|nr:histone [DPANN group archaeon]